MTARPSRDRAGPSPPDRAERRLPGHWPGSWEEFQAARARFHARLAAERVLREVSAAVTSRERAAPTA